MTQGGDMDRMRLLRLRLRTRLAYLGKTQAALAEHLGMSRAKFNARMRATDVRLSFIFQMADAIGVPEAYLTDPSKEQWAYLRALEPRWVTDAT